MLTTEAIVAHKHPENPEALSQPSEGVDNEERNDFFMIGKYNFLLRDLRPEQTIHCICGSWP